MQLIQPNGSQKWKTDPGATVLYMRFCLNRWRDMLTPWNTNLMQGLFLLREMRLSKAFQPVESCTTIDFTHCGLVLPYVDIDLGQHGPR